MARKPSGPASHEIVSASALYGSGEGVVTSRVGIASGGPQVIGA